MNVLKSIEFIVLVSSLLSVQLPSEVIEAWSILILELVQ